MQFRFPVSVRQASVWRTASSWCVAWGQLNISADSLSALPSLSTRSVPAPAFSCTTARCSP